MGFALQHVAGGKFVSVDSTLFQIALSGQQKNIKSVTDKALSIKTTEMHRVARRNLDAVTTQRSGDTRKSIVKERFGPRQYIVGSKYSVARFLENGTKNMSKRPWLLPAVLTVGPTIAPFILQRVGQSWKGSGMVSVQSRDGLGASADFSAPALGSGS